MLRVFMISYFELKLKMSLNHLGNECNIRNLNTFENNAENFLVELIFIVYDNNDNVTRLPIIE